MAERLGKYVEVASQVDPQGKNLKKLAVGVGIAGVAAGLAAIALGITERNHRQLTHRSVELHPWLEKLADAEQRSLGIEGPEVWAAVHRIHHRKTDVTEFPFYRLKHAIDAAEQQGIPVPDQFPHLDRFVPQFSREVVESIGTYADDEVRERLGEEYQVPQFATKDEILAILHPKEPQYYYPDYGKKEDQEYTQDDIAQLLLTDPHSPALVRRENGVQGILAKNMPYYQRPAKLFRAKPSIKPEDLQTGNEGNEKSVVPSVVAGFVLPSVAIFAARGDYSREGALTAAIAGSAMNGIRTLTELAGGNVTNSLGHMGVSSDNRIMRALFQTSYKIELKPDGTLATDTVRTGVAGRILSWLTFDEVGGQEKHHKWPDKIAYTDKEGLEAWLEAPWGSFTAWLAESNIPLIKPGEGFGVPREERPDMPSKGVLLIQQARAREYERQHAKLERRSFDNTPITNVVDGI